MSSKYKSPLIRSRTTSAVSPDAAPQQTAESPAQPSDRGPVDDRFGNGLVFDNRPQSLPDAPRNWRGRGSGSPRFNSPRQNSPRPPRGSPYQWTPPNRHNGSWSSDPNHSGGYTPQDRNSFTSYRSQFKYKKQNFNNSNNENGDESYFHPSMLEDPWAPLINNSANCVQ